RGLRDEILRYPFNSQGRGFICIRWLHWLAFHSKHLLHCGWFLGGVQDRYFRYESAGDQYLGRVVAGLPLNSSAFAN
ncbi:hypothetical protein JG688_00018572, partial [Phytophthora aleatoria]